MINHCGCDANQTNHATNNRHQKPCSDGRCMGNIHTVDKLNSTASGAILEQHSVDNNSEPCRPLHCVHDNESPLYPGTCNEQCRNRNDECAIMSHDGCINSAMRHCNARPAAIGCCCKSTESQQQNGHGTTKPESDYANMSFINSISLYENMCFVRGGREEPPNTWNKAAIVLDENQNKCDHSETKERIESPSSQCAGNSLCTHQPNDSENNEDNKQANSSDESVTEQTSDTIEDKCEVSEKRKSMSESARSQTNHGDQTESKDELRCDLPSDGTTAQMCQLQRQTHLDRQESEENMMPRLAQRDPLKTNADCSSYIANHYERDVSLHKSELNISLPAPNNRASYGKLPVEESEAFVKENDSSIANQIMRNKLQKSCCVEPLLRTKSYSIDDISGKEFAINGNTANSVTNKQTYKSDQLLNVIYQSRTIDWRREYSSCWPCVSDSDSEDFCSSSQITILCQNQI